MPIHSAGTNAGGAVGATNRGAGAGERSRLPGAGAGRRLSLNYHLVGAREPENGDEEKGLCPPPLHGHVVDTDVVGVRLYFCLDASQFLSELPGLPTGHSGGIVSIGTAQENFSVVCFLPP